MCGLISESTPCVYMCAWKERERLGVCLWVCEKTLQHGASLCRLATPVHQGQSVCNKKYVYKWGSYFYPSTTSQGRPAPSLFLLSLFFGNVLLLFLIFLLFCSMIIKCTKLAKFSPPIHFFLFCFSLFLWWHEFIRNTFALVFLNRTLCPGPLFDKFCLFFFGKDVYLIIYFFNVQDCFMSCKVSVNSEE